MSDGKGKGRASRDENTKHNPPPEDSMLSQVAASATGLARSAFTTLCSNKLNGRVAAALSDAGKVQSSTGNSSSAWAESSRASQQPSYQGSESSSFRPGHNEGHIRQSESEFSSFLDSIGSFKLSENATEDQLGRCKRDKFEDAWVRSQGAKGLKSQPIHGTVAEQESHDGEEVLAILSDPGETADIFGTPTIDNEDFDWGLTAEQISQLRAMTEDILPPPEPHVPTSVENPLNLRPTFEDASNFNRSIPQIDTNGDESHIYFGVNGQPRVAKQMWIEQWEDVLTRYTDEVWGGLLPLVQEARREIEGIQIDLGKSTEQLKALRRLGLIFGHLRNH
jgi:hypothetical protein